MLHTASPSFTWNYFMLKTGGFVQNPDFHPWCIALIHGAVYIQQCSLNGKLLRWSLVSRRSTKRAGTRYDYIVKISTLWILLQVIVSDRNWVFFTENRNRTKPKKYHRNRNYRNEIKPKLFRCQFYFDASKMQCFLLQVYKKYQNVDMSWTFTSKVEVS